MDEIELINSKASDKKWICTDFFDTLVYRDLTEDGLVWEWSNKVASLTRYAVSPFEMYTLRNEIPRHMIRSKGIEEVKFTEICKEIYLKIYKQILNVSVDEFTKECHDAAIEVELNHIFVHERRIDFLRRCKEDGKKIAVVSDSIYTEEMMRDLINKLGFIDLIDYVFVSSEYDARKRSGNLYKRIRDALNPDKVLMIGDNKASDVDNAIANGIEAVQIINLEKHRVETVSYDENGLNKIITEDKTAFAGYAFGLYVFIERLYKELLKKNANSVFFLSREGLFLKKLFDEYQAKRSVRFETNYIYVSRKATLLPSLYRRGSFDYSGLFLTYNELDIYSFLRNLSFDDNQIDQVLSEYPYDRTKTITKFNESQEFLWLLSNDLYNKFIQDNYQKQNKVFRDYLFQHITDGNKIYLVDIGWKGTIQDNIYFALGEEYKIFGFYFGINQNTGFESSNNVKTGVVFDLYPQKSDNYKYFNFETHLIEQLLCAPHASTKGYKYEGDCANPVLGIFGDDEKRLYESSEKIQNSIFLTFQKIYNCVPKIILPESIIYRRLNRLYYRATLLLSNESVSYEKVALNSKTNNFGWFDKGPTRNKSSKTTKKMLIDLKNVLSEGDGLPGIVRYLSVKMNARKKYSWKILVYKVLYIFTVFRVN